MGLKNRVNVRRLRTVQGLEGTGEDEGGKRDRKREGDYKEQMKAGKL